MSIKAKIEAIIYAAEEPVTFEQIFTLVKEDTRQQIAEDRAVEPAQPETSSAEAAAEPALRTTPEGDQETNTDAGSSAVTPTTQDEVETTETEADIATATGETETAGDISTTEETLAAPEIGQTPQDATPAAEVESAPLVITDAEVKAALREIIQELLRDYASPDRGIEIRQIAGGFRMATKPEQHDMVRSFAKSLKPPIRLSMQALETLAVIAYKQPITAPEISEVRGVDSGGVLGTLLDRKLITTAGRKQVIGRPILYKTTKEFLLRFGLKDVNELPSMEEFEKLAAESLGADLFASAQTVPTPEQAEAQTAAAEAPVPVGEVSAGSVDEYAQVDAEVSDAAQLVPSPLDAERETAVQEAPLTGEAQMEGIDEQTSPSAAVEAAPAPETRVSAEQAEAQTAAMEAPVRESAPQAASDTNTELAERELQSVESEKQAREIQTEPE